jgi:Na+/H+ antiporter NhaD/arsenite permease-like protein
MRFGVIPLPFETGLICPTEAYIVSGFMKFPANRLFVCCLIVFVFLPMAEPAIAAGGAPPAADTEPFPRLLDSYNDAHIDNIWEKIVFRAKEEPFNLFATLVFFCAIVHTFLAGYFRSLAHKLEHAHEKKLKSGEIKAQPEGPQPVSFKATMLHFLGEVEAIFGIWLVPLGIVILVFFDWTHLFNYIDSVHYTEPIFVVVIMAMSATRPVIKFAEYCTSRLAALGGSTPGAWWISIMLLLPLLGSFITEPAAMTIAAMLLCTKFYDLDPSLTFKYATIGLLFVAISVGGTLTHFAAPPVLMVATRWELTTPLMIQHLGWKAIIGIVICVTIIYYIFRRELRTLNARYESRKSDIERLKKHEEPVPAWIIVVHLMFLAYTVLVLHHPAMVVGGLLFFMAFTTATVHHQYQISLKGPVLVGFFLAGLVTHGGFQAWWIAPLLSGLDEIPLFVGATFLTAINDNAAITYLASLVPELDPHLAGDVLRSKLLEYAVLTGAVTGGGLTVIANAPNPAGQSILNKYFPNGVNPLYLLLAAIGPTIVVALCFKLLFPGF